MADVEHLSDLSDEALEALLARVQKELEARASKKRPGDGSAAGSAGEAALEPEPEEFSNAVVELETIEARMEFAKVHGLEFEEGIQDTLEEDLDCFGVPERYAHGCPLDCVPYRRQKPGICFFPSDRDAVYVISLGAFVSVPSLNAPRTRSEVTRTR